MVAVDGPVTATEDGSSYLGDLARVCSEGLGWERLRAWRADGSNPSEKQLVL